MSDDAVQARLQKFFPVATPYEIVHRNLYVTHQRVAEHIPQGACCSRATPRTSTIRSAAWA